MQDICLKKSAVLFSLTKVLKLKNKKQIIYKVTQNKEWIAETNDTHRDNLSPCQKHNQLAIVSSIVGIL